MSQVTVILRLFFDYNFEAIELQGFLPLSIKPPLIYERLGFYQVKNEAIWAAASRIEKKNAGSVLLTRLWRALPPGRPSSTIGSGGLMYWLGMGLYVSRSPPPPEIISF